MNIHVELIVNGLKESNITVVTPEIEVPECANSDDFVRKCEEVLNSCGTEALLVLKEWIQSNTIKSAILCKHANEVPVVCPCDEDCYCKSHSCKPKN